MKNPEKYGWEPKWLLSHIIDIYLHLDGEPLAQAVANDERSFKIQTFQASSLLSLYYHCTIYLHLDGEPLAQAVANDERSFKIQTFQASSLLSLYRKKG